MRQLPFRIATVILLTSILVIRLGCNREADKRVLESNRWLEMLKVLPANQNTLMAVYMNDLAKLKEKIQQYPQLELKYAITFGHPLIGSRGYDEEEWKQTLAFTLEDVEQSVYAGATRISSKPTFRTYEAVHCAFDTSELENTMKTGPLNEALQTVTYKGIQFYSWGNDNEINPLWRSRVRPLGQGYRLALIDNFLYWVSWTDGMEEIIDCHENNIDSLANNEEYQLLAQKLEHLDVVTAFFSSESQSRDSLAEWRKQTPHYFNDEDGQRFLIATQNTVLLEPYQALATGAGIDGHGYYLAIALLSSDGDVASKNATLLGQRIDQLRSVWRGSKWADSIESMEIHSEGRFTVAKIYGPIVEYWDSFDKWNGNYEPLLASK